MGFHEFFCQNKLQWKNLSNWWVINDLCNLTRFLNFFSGCRISIGVTRIVISQTKPSGENRRTIRQWPKRSTNEIHLPRIRNTHRQQFSAFACLARKSLWPSWPGMHCTRDDRPKTRLKYFLSFVLIFVLIALAR